jgi:hypothetical protein
MLRLLREYWRLSAVERALVRRAAVSIASYRVALSVLPFRRVVARTPEPVPRATTSAHLRPDRIAWAVRACARRVPGASCLTRALATRWLLAREGVYSTLHYGWRKDERNRLQAHAWIDCEGEVLMGADEDLGTFHLFGR